MLPAGDANGHAAADASQCPSNRTAIAIASDKHRPFILQRIHTCLCIIERLRKRVKITGQFNGAVVIGAGLVRLKPGMLSVENSRRKDVITVGRIFIA